MQNYKNKCIFVANYFFNIFMKKLTLILISALVLVTGVARHAEACTNFLVTKGASKSGATMISYTADSHVLYGSLVYRPAADYAAGSMVNVFDWDSGRLMGQIPQVAHTYSVVGNMNEHQLLIGESTYGGLPQLRDTTAIIDYGSLIYITLQRCKTAREAVEYMGWLVSEYGYASSGESISIADPNEVWYLEIISKGMKIVKGKNVNKGAVWVALRVPDGMISAHANHARITTFPQNDPANCLYAKDVVSFARESGLYKGSDADFDFSATYAPLDFSAMRGCEARVWSIFRQAGDRVAMDEYVNYALGKDASRRLPLWIKPAEKLDVKRVAAIMRDHYDGTPLDMHNDLGAGGHGLPYRWRPMDFEVGGKTYTNERAIATQQTGWWYVGECRSWLPDPVGGVLWFGTDDVATSPLTPIYCGTTRIPWCLDQRNGHLTQYSETSMFWIQNRVTNFAYLRYDMMHADVQAAMHEFEDNCFVQQKAIEEAAVTLYNTKPELCVNFVSDYTVAMAQKLFDTWCDLDKYLLVKYIDGNVKRESSSGVFITNGHNLNNQTVPVMPMMPGYNQCWKEAVVEAHGAQILVPEQK